MKLILGICILLSIGLLQAQTFLVFGHIYPNHRAIESNLNLIEKQNPDFIVFLGDSYLNESKISKKSFKRIVDKLEDKNITTHFVVGNHDKRLIPHFYSFYSKNLTFLILDSNNITKSQMQYITQLSKSNKPDIIFIHHCLFSLENQQEFCNSEQDWNDIYFQNKIVFVGDTGKKTSHFFLKENNVSYFGVGFAKKKFNQPKYMLKVKGEISSFEVTPIQLPTRIQKLKSFYLNIRKRCIKKAYKTYKKWELKNHI